jgi:hypothetical protein
MAKYRKKPVVVEAIPCVEIITKMALHWQELPKWVSYAYEEGIIRAITIGGFTVATLEGPHTALRGDMLIRGIQGEIYPCKRSIFAQTYDLVEEK